MNLVKVPFVLCVLSLLLSGSANATDPRSYIAAVHDQYLSTDFQSEDDVAKLLSAVKSGLEKAQSAVPEDLTAEENLLGLFNQVLIQAEEERTPKDLLKVATGKKNLESIFAKLKDYEAKHGKIIPVGWSLPEEFKIIVAEVDRKYEAYKGKVEFAFGLYVWLNDNEEMPEQMQVIRYPNTVILDKEGCVGDWSDGRKWQTPSHAFSFNAEGDTNPPKNGLYLLNIKMKNKPMVQGWFVVNEMTLNEGPLVSAPFSGQVFKSSNPTVRWVNFKSQQFHDFESNKRQLSVYKIENDSRKGVWGRQEVFPDDSESFVVDDSTDTGGHPHVSLSDGNYQFEVNFQERWFFGDILMQRASGTRVPFTISH